ncbi:MFS general substrate transporter [Suillus subalutaceus]|uniref:MFS general substrate transporter n=1 Tax=Suillus subalutaceus TaxID=48586 RepID=UPI001B886F34|nr:MFS general substrate transporter [Suillus subalutaceus]KAG1874485.1 MFS general substrate transporter [Suillus subalutaceus]
MSDRPLLDVGNYSPRYGASESGNNNDTPILPYSDEQSRAFTEKRLLRKLDLRVAFLVLIYIMNYMDRSNAAAARLRGFEEDLDMKGNQFNTLISILYVGYVLMQAPSSHEKAIAVPLKLHGNMGRYHLVHQYRAALILRFLLGFVEAAFFPGAVFLLSQWYKRNELGLRTALLTCGSSVSNAFSALIASGILAGLDGILGFTAWRWLFLVEGTLTIIVAVCAIWILPDFPSTPSVWLLPDEQILAKRRMEEDAAAGNEDQGKPVEGFSGLSEAVMDWRVWWLGVALSFMTASLSFGNFFPDTICYNGLQRNYQPLALRTSMDFRNCDLVFCGQIRHSDATGDRFWHITGPLLLGIVGFVIAMSTMNTAVRYLSLFFMTQSSVAYIIFLTWVLNTFSQSRSKRAAAIALINSMATFGNIGASYFWPSSWGPSYVNSYFICILTGAMSIAMCWAFRKHLSRCNGAAEAEEHALGLPKGFRYLL